MEVLRDHQSRTLCTEPFLLSAHRTEQAGSPGAHSAFTVLELLVSITIVGVLAAIVLPAIAAARETAHRVQCSSNLRQVGIALNVYHDCSGSLPTGWQWDEMQRSAYGWAVELLPSLEQAAVHQAVDASQPLNAPVNAAARSLQVTILVCPSDHAAREFPLFAELPAVSLSVPPSASEEPLIRLPTASYVGVFGISEPDDTIPAPPGEGAFIESRPIRVAEFQRGVTNTLFVGERTMAQLPSTWLGIDSRGEDAACRLVGIAATAPNCSDCDECEFTSRHPGGANFLWGDGHVELVANSIDRLVYRRLSTRLD